MCRVICFGHKPVPLFPSLPGDDIEPIFFLPKPPAITHLGKVPLDGIIQSCDGFLSLGTDQPRKLHIFQPVIREGAITLEFPNRALQLTQTLKPYFFIRRERPASHRVCPSEHRVQSFPLFTPLQFPNHMVSRFFPNPAFQAQDGIV